MASDDQWRSSLREAMAERAMRHRRPDPEELIAYVEGRLSPGEREAIEEAAALHPDVARDLAELSAFPDVEAAPGAAAPSEDEVTASWERFRPRLEEMRRRGAVPALRAVATGGVAPAGKAPHLRRWSLAHAAALFFSLTTAGLLFVVVHGTTRPRPLANVELAELAPIGEEVRRTAGTETVTLPAGDQLLVLVLDLVDPREFPSYRLTLSSADGEPLWTTEDLRRFEDGTFRLLLPSHLVREARYGIEVDGLGPAGRVPLARYELIVEVE